MKFLHLKTIVLELFFIIRGCCRVYEYIFHQRNSNCFRISDYLVKKKKNVKIVQKYSKIRFKNRK